MGDTFRQHYTPLTPEQVTDVRMVKRAAQMFDDVLESIEENPAYPIDGLVSVIKARAELVTATMWAVRGITTPTEDKPNA